MTEPPVDTKPLPLDASPDQPTDPEFDRLPQPRRPGKRPTLVVLCVTALSALLLAGALRQEALYSLHSEDAVDVGELAAFKPNPGLANTWIRGAGLLTSTGAIRYSRPLEQDSFRLSPLADNPELWVEIRVPAGLEGPHFVPPNSFVGRLVPLHRAGLRHHRLDAVVSRVTGVEIGQHTWLLVDGEAPAETRWALGLVALFLGFAAFNLWGLYRLLRPVRS
jgi:hypothetical protein